MSTAVHEVSRLPFLVPNEEVARSAFQVSRGGAFRMELPRVVPASRLEDRPAPATVMTGIAALDALTGGLPRGGLTEICGPASSGRTSVVLSLMAAMTSGFFRSPALAKSRLGRGTHGNPVYPELCALVDASDSFDPKSAEAAGVELRRLLWVRCSKTAPATGHFSRNSQLGTRNSFLPSTIDYRPSTLSGVRSQGKSQMDALEQALKATDLLLQSGGFGLVVVDLGDVPAQAARRVPLTSWFRFRRAVENTRTVLVVVEQEPYAKTCASVVVRLSAMGRRLSARTQVAGCRVREEPAHGRILSGLEITAEVLRSSAHNKKPVQSAEARFSSRMEWTG